MPVLRSGKDVRTGVGRGEWESGFRRFRGGIGVEIGSLGKTRFLGSNDSRCKGRYAIHLVV